MVRSLPVRPGPIQLTRQRGGSALREGYELGAAQGRPVRLKARRCLPLPALGLARVVGAQGEADALHGWRDADVDGLGAEGDGERATDGRRPHIGRDALHKLGPGGVSPLNGTDDPIEHCGTPL